MDIHIFVEKKVKGRWVPAEAMMKDEGGKLDVPYPQKIYTGRDYELFGFLTGGQVRTDIGVYAGRLKGFPKDASKQVKKIYGAWGVDGHTPNYITLKELNQVDWNRKITDNDGKQIALKDRFDHFFYDVMMRMDFYDIRVHNPAHIRLVFWFDN